MLERVRAGSVRRVFVMGQLRRALALRDWRSSMSFQEQVWIWYCVMLAVKLGEVDIDVFVF